MKKFITLGPGPTQTRLCTATDRSLKFGNRYPIFFQTQLWMSINIFVELLQTLNAKERQGHNFQEVYQLASF